MKYFLDTEFIESGAGHPVELLSVGIFSEDGREYYAVNGDADRSHANDWVKANVLPHLGIGKRRFANIKADIRNFVGDDKPEFWGYYADYDWVVFCQIFGTMMDLPKGWPMYCRDIKQICDLLGNPQLPGQTSTEHNALNDAKWNKLAHEFLRVKWGELLEAAEPSFQYQRMRENWSNVCASEVFQELKHGKFKGVMYLLQDGQISVGRAAQAIAEIAHSGETELLAGTDYRESEYSWKERAEAAEAHRDRLAKALREIAKGEGPFSKDNYEFACNVIEQSKRIAAEALKEAGNGE